MLLNFDLCQTGELIMLVFVLLVFLLLLESTRSQQCFNAPSCFTYTYENCSMSKFGAEEDAVHIVLDTLDFDDVEDIFYQSVLTLLCEEFNSPAPNLNGSVDLAPYCWDTVAVSQEPCTIQCNCTGVDLVIYDMQSHRVLPAQQVAVFLNEAQSLLALQFAGVFIADVTAEGVRSGVALFDVPIISWVFVGVGLIVSFVVLTAPAWWNVFKQIGGACK